MRTIATSLIWLRTRNFNSASEGWNSRNLNVKKNCHIVLPLMIASRRHWKLTTSTSSSEILKLKILSYAASFPRNHWYLGGGSSKNWVVTEMNGFEMNLARVRVKWDGYRNWMQKKKANESIRLAEIDNRPIRRDSTNTPKSTIDASPDNTNHHHYCRAQYSWFIIQIREANTSCASKFVIICWASNGPLYGVNTFLPSSPRVSVKGYH